MTITEFLKKVGFKPYGSVVNSWDSFNDFGEAMMQLWHEPGQRVRNHSIAEAYLRVRCFDAAHYERDAKNKVIGYAGRDKAIKLVESGARGYAALSSPPDGEHGPGAWAKYADLSKVYPILKVERSVKSGDIFVILGQPIKTESIVRG